MAIEYSIVVNTNKSPEDLLVRLSRPLSFQRCEGPRFEVAADGIVCTAIHQSKVGQQLVEETFGISTSVTIDCRIDKFDQMAAGMSHLIDLCLCLIQCEPSDFVLLTNHESGLLLRKRGHLEADCRDQYWEDKWNTKFLSAGVNFVPASLPMI